VVNSAAPTILALETDSAWVVILAVSLVTLLAALLVRRVFTRPAGLASGLLLALPLGLPIVAAVAYERALLPELAVLQPAGSAVLGRSSNLLHLLMLSDGSDTVTVYGVTGSAGRWIVLFGAGIASFMLLRRLVGTLMVQRLIRRCVPLGERHPDVHRAVVKVAGASNLKRTPEIFLLPPGVSGAFAVGVRRGKILISSDLIEDLEPSEMEAIMAHEVAHLESRDVPLLIAAGFFRDVVAWNPFAHLAFKRLVNDRELEADRRAAALTNDPLSVASGLLKMCDLVKRRRSIGQKAALAFLKPGARISRRVTSLIAVADGRLSAAQTGSLPFVFAGLMVALLGLQVGERIASDQTGAFAIVWGTPSGTEGDVWKVPKRMMRPDKGVRPVSKEAASRPGIPLRSFYPELESGLRVRAADMGTWMTAVGQRLQRVGLSGATVRWEARSDWRAIPLFEPPVGPRFGIYRIARQP
jgi:Zn-dependent protease with chaperone function